MAVNFNQDSVFNLKPISNDEVRGEVDGLLIADEKVEEIANETAADDIYRQALESIRKEREKESTGYGSEYDTTYSSVLTDYSIYLEDDGEGDESDEK